MLFRSTKVARVKTKAELDAALVSADRVIVEGDDALLSYAATQAAKHPALRQIDIQTPRTEISGGIGGQGLHPVAAAAGTMSSPSPAPPGAAPPIAAPPPRRLGNHRILLSLTALGVLIAAAGAWYAVRDRQAGSVPTKALEMVRPVTPNGHTATDRIESFPQTLLQINPSPAPSPPPSAVNPPAGAHATPPSTAVTSQSLSAMSQSLAWPAVAIIAIVALFLIARQAIAGGRNVEIAWKVTEKVSGRLVITKVQTRTRTRSAA